jgi:hypothetical protein
MVLLPADIEELFAVAARIDGTAYQRKSNDMECTFRLCAPRPMQRRVSSNIRVSTLSSQG